MQEVQSKTAKKTPGGSSRKGQQLDKARATIRHQLKTVEGWKRDAFNRWKEQERKGQHESADRSKQAFEYCCSYEKRLKHILEGYDAQENGKNYFTKDMRARFRNSATGKRG